MLTLYDYELSVNCYKVRLLLNFLSISHKLHPIDFFPGWEHKSEWFKEINPLGHIPVIDDDGYILRDSNAILIYLASKYDDSLKWYPTHQAELLGEVSQWMMFSEGTTNTASAARLHDSLGYEFDIEVCRSGAHRLFRLLDEHLWFREQQNLGWLCSAEYPTRADLAIFPDVILSEEGGINRVSYPAVRRWTDRFRRLPNFSLMAGVLPAGTL
jgi:glutathione S-transferase